MRFIRFPNALTLDQMLHDELGDSDFVLPGLPAGSVGGLVSPGGVGKSFWALSVVMSVATGYSLCGLEAAQGGVLYLAAEDPVARLVPRLRAYAHQVPEHLRDLSALDIRCCYGTAMNLLDDDCLLAMVKMAHGKRLVVLDTLSRFHGLDENSSRDMSAVMSALERLAMLSGAAVLFLHHTSKHYAANNQGSLQQAARGSSVLVDNARWVSFLAPMDDQAVRVWGMQNKDKNDYVRWNISKQNYGIPQEDRWYRRGEHGALEYIGSVLTKNISQFAAHRPKNEQREALPRTDGSRVPAAEQKPW